MRRKILTTLLFMFVAIPVVFFMLAPAYVEAGRNRVRDIGPIQISAEAQALHDQLLIADWHADSLLWDRDIGQRVTRGHVDLPRLIDGNVAVQIFTAVTKSPAGQNYEANSDDAHDNITLLVVGQLRPIRTWTSLLERGLDQAARLAKAADDYPDMLTFVRNSAQLDAALAARGDSRQPIAGILGAEGAHLLEGDLTNLDTIYDAGFRVIGLTHFFNNALGGSLHGDRALGLTPFGRDVVAGLEQREMIIDLAHASPAMAQDVLDMTTRPVIVSHTGIFSHCETVRNFPDSLMQDIAAKGGLRVLAFGKKSHAISPPQALQGP